MDANKLYSEIKHLATKINGYYDMPEFDRDIAITNAYMNVWKKMQEGKVPSSEYNDYKGYLFISMKSHINKYFANLKLKKNANEERMTEGVDYDTEFEFNNAEYNLLLEDKLKHLKKGERNLIKLKIDGYTRLEIAEVLDLGPVWVSVKFGQIKKKLK